MYGRRPTPKILGKNKFQITMNLYTIFSNLYALKTKAIKIKYFQKCKRNSYSNDVRREKNRVARNIIIFVIVFLSVNSVVYI